MNGQRLSDQRDAAEEGTRSCGQYTAFAGAYADGGERHFSERMALFALQRATRYRRLPLRYVVDVACGIGAACALFAQEGLSVTGVDQSPDMLRYARQLSEAANVSVDFVAQDIRDLNLERPADLVTCMYDSLNFMLSTDELHLCFSRIRNVLNPNGIFVFDMYTIRGLSEFWGTRVELHSNLEDHFVVTQTAWESGLAINTKTFHGFSRSGEVWRRWQETHIVHAFPINQVQVMLAKLGFVVHEISDWDDPAQGPPSLTTFRFVVVAERP